MTIRTTNAPTASPPSLVAVVPCADYDAANVLSAVRKGLALLGGAARFAAPGVQVLLKPNLVFAHEAERAVTTHPAVFEAVIRVFQEETKAVLSYGDSPGFAKPLGVARKAGLAEVADRLGVALADFEDGRAVQVPDALECRELVVARAVLETDVLVSIPKMKTHRLVRLTGAIKNQLGCVLGLNKGKMHVRFPNLDGFCRMLVDINRLVKPRLCIMDGIVAMDGNGPSSGDPYPMGLLLFSEDPVALDSVFARLVGLSPSAFPTIVHAEKAGLGKAGPEDVTIVGVDDFDALIRADFRVPRSPTLGDSLFYPLKPFKNLFLSRPVIDEKLCRRCGICIDACPVEPKVLAFPKRDGPKRPPAYEYARCIRCFCCQEMCPHKAVRVVEPVLGRLVSRFLGHRRAGPQSDERTSSAV